MLTPKIQKFLLFLFAFLLFLAIDLIWMSWSGPNLYQAEIGQLLASKPKLIPALFFFLLYIFSLCVFVIFPSLKHDVIEHKTILLLSALFGATAYATFDLTNYAMLKDYSLKVTIIDIIWGASLTAFVSVCTYKFGLYLKLRE